MYIPKVLNVPMIHTPIAYNHVPKVHFREPSQHTEVATSAPILTPTLIFRLNLSHRRWEG